jgi:hypothetical protein
MDQHAWKSETCDECRFMVVINRTRTGRRSGDCRFGPPMPMADSSADSMAYPKVSWYPCVNWTTPACSQYQRTE